MCDVMGRCVQSTDAGNHRRCGGGARCITTAGIGTAIHCGNHQRAMNGSKPESTATDPSLNTAPRSGTVGCGQEAQARGTGSSCLRSEQWHIVTRGSARTGQFLTEYRCVTAATTRDVFVWTIYGSGLPVTTIGIVGPRGGVRRVVGRSTPPRRCVRSATLTPGTTSIRLPMGGERVGPADERMNGDVGRRNVRSKTYVWTVAA